MIKDNLEFHNVTELASDPLKGGWHLKRFPESLRTSAPVNKRARFVMNYAVASEIRFVSDAPVVHLYLETQSDSPSDVIVFKGDFPVGRFRVGNGITEKLILREPERFALINEGKLQSKRFSPRVWRVFFGRSEVIFRGVDAMGHSLRPPAAEEKPARTVLAYGSSITMGAGSSDFHNSYAVQTARLLDADIINLGLGGACHVEKEIADFIASRDDWDMGSFELGVNMRNFYPPEEYAKRVKYFIDTVSAAHPEKPLFFITVFPNFAGYLRKPDMQTKRDDEYSEILRELVAEKKSPLIHLIEGGDVLDDFSGLAGDLIHPSDEGHHGMARNLAGRINVLHE